MNLNKLYKFKDKFTDLQLILVDNLMETTLNVHKIILISSCPYFETMFNNDFIEKNNNTLTINVPCSIICNEIILSFYGNPIKDSLLKNHYIIYVWIFLTLE